ncbi:SHOCT domain-containing protein [Cellulosimicrobium protaetiae]|uniref:SHOCT domain-containing protein n=1 Tax=Cellulosimicrobium protaetiae TaxID=2587808 RepID=A0A6M5UEZ2_9MICO|nr:SHOCT domain-containing protein [Cellulosimicrobium protaetiae]QJW36624.1 SHOCT domain-containing protein [Cellulosimicrobium protaetiae]
MDGTTSVEVTILGPVALAAADLAELGVTRSVECTLLEATVRDQAALYGLLQRLAALGLDLLGLRTAAPGRRADVEVVVRGPVGPLVQEMLRDVESTRPGALTTSRAPDHDVAGLLGVLAGARQTDVKIAQLRALAALRDQGVLTDTELEAQKALVLGA